MPRYSVNVADPGYENLCRVRRAGRLLLVYLDGKEQRDVVIADEESGLIVRRLPLPRGEDGKLVIPEDGELKTETLHGAVTCVVAESPLKTILPTLFDNQ